ncbi:Tetratricopeptide repeat protein [compost metagenome]
MKVTIFLFILSFNYIVSNAREINNISTYSIEAKFSDSSKAVRLYNKGLLFNKNKDFKNAYQCFDRAIALKANFAEAYLGRAVLKYKISSPVGMWDDFLMAIKLRPNFGEAYYERGIIKTFISGRTPNNDGETDFKKATELGFNRELSNFR